MIYAIATHAALVAIEFDAAWNIKSHKVLNQGYHYGIALANNQKNRATENSQQLIAYRGGTSVIAHDDIQLMTYESMPPFQLIQSTSLSGDVYDLHQIACANGGMYLANTKYNSLIFQSPEGVERHRYIFEGKAYDFNHINSIYPCGNQIFVLLHNKSRKESELAILEHDGMDGFKLNQTLSLWHGMCHNIFIDDHYLFYNASAARQFVAVNLATERVQTHLAFSKHHTKAMSVTGDYIVIGLSAHTAHYLNRIRSQGYLAIIDRRSLTTIKIVDINIDSLPHPIGNINEVRCLSEPELAHARPYVSEVAWDKIRLAQSNPLHYQVMKAQINLMKPVRNLKRYWEKKKLPNKGSGQMHLTTKPTDAVAQNLASNER